MNKKQAGMKRKQLYRKACSYKYPNEKKAPATVCILQKKLKNLRRQYHSLEVEIQNLRDKNIELANSVQIEKLEQAKLKDEHHELKSRYHSLAVNYNSTKEELIRAHQLITTLEDDISLAFSRVLKFSEGITIAKSRIREHFSFTQSKFHKGKEENEFSSQHSLTPIKDSQNLRCGVPVKQRVGPMIKGYPITKPKIMLKRISVPVQQELGDLEETDSGDTSNDAQAVPPLTPVLEEEENVVSGPELSLTQRHKAGFRYRLHPMRNDDKNNSSNNNNEEPASVVIPCETDVENTKNCDMEPVVRLHDVSQTFENSTVFQVNGPDSSFRIIAASRSMKDKERNKEDKIKPIGRKLNMECKEDATQNRNLKRPCEDPLEGCSWMYNSRSKRKYANRKRRSQPKRRLYFEGRPFYSSDDSLSDDENSVQNSHGPNNNSSNSNVHESPVGEGKKSASLKSNFTAPVITSSRKNNNIFVNNSSNETGNAFSESNNAVNMVECDTVEGKVIENIAQESSLCPYYDPTNPKHNSDRKLCNSCEICIGLQITIRPRSKLHKNAVQYTECVSVEPESSDSETFGFSKISNSWVCNSGKNSVVLVLSPSKNMIGTCTLTPEANDKFQISKDVHTSTPELNEKLHASKVALPNVILQRLEPELGTNEMPSENHISSSFTRNDNADKNFSSNEKSIKINDSIDLNKNSKLKTSVELNESVNCVQGNISEDSVRKSERKSSLRKLPERRARRSSTSKRLPPKTRRQSRRLSESGIGSTDNESSEEAGISSSRPRRNVSKVNYKLLSLRKKLRQE